MTNIHSDEKIRNCKWMPVPFFMINVINKVTKFFQLKWLLVFVC